MLCMSDASNSDAAMAIDAAATASQTLAHVLCLIVGFMDYLISGIIANSLHFASVITSISRL